MDNALTQSSRKRRILNLGHRRFTDNPQTFHRRSVGSLCLVCGMSVAERCAQNSHVLCRKTLKVNRVTVPYTVIKRKVKYPRLEFRTGVLTVILPQSCVDERSLLDRHKRWILRKYKYIQEATKESSRLKLVKKRTRATFHRLVRRFVRKYSKKFDVKASGILFMQMKSGWAHASAGGRLTFSIMMRHLPRCIIEYIACHEAAHLKVFKHDSDFWKLVREQFPDPEHFEMDLLAYWFLLHKAPNGFR